MAEKLGNRSESLGDKTDGAWEQIGREVQLRQAREVTGARGVGEGLVAGVAEKSAQHDNTQRLEQLRQEAQRASRGTAAKNGNADNNQAEALDFGYETELKTPNDVINDLQNYVIRDGVVYRKVNTVNAQPGEKGNVRLVPETDEDASLRVKTSRFLFNEAQNLRNKAKHVAGKRFVDRGPQYYIDQAMARYAIRDEENSYATNKLVRNLVNNGGVTETIGTPELADTKFEMLDGLRADYGRALLERKMRQRGQTIKDVKVDIDNSTFKKDGYSTVEIKLATGELVDNSYAHPAAAELMRLDTQLREALQNKDYRAHAKYLAEAREMVRKNGLQVTEREWQQAKESRRRRWAELKMKEARVLGDKQMFSLWRNRRETGQW